MTVGWANLVFRIVARQAVAASFLFYPGTDRLPDPVMKAFEACNWQVKQEVFNLARRRGLVGKDEPLAGEWDHNSVEACWALDFIRYYRLAGRRDPQ